MLKSGARILSLAAVIVASANVAHAAPANLNQLLKGDYAFSGETSCLVSRGGFNANLTPVSPGPFPFVISFSVQGVRTFNGDGTGSVVARVVTISHPFALPVTPPFFSRGGASSSDVEATFTYQVAPDRTVAVDNATLTGTTLTGPNAGQTFTITNFPLFSGYLSKDRRTLTLAHLDPAVETHTSSNNTSDERICHRSRILLQLKDGD